MEKNAKQVRVVFIGGKVVTALDKLLCRAKKLSVVDNTGRKEFLVHLKKNRFTK